MIKTTRVAIRINDNNVVNQWAREASAIEKKAVFSADILERLIKKHIRVNGNRAPNNKVESDSEPNIQD